MSNSKQIVHHNKRIIGTTGVRTPHSAQPNRSAMGPIQTVSSAYAERDFKHTEKALSDFSGVLKLYMGACNNATFLVMGNAFDAMKKHPIWKQKFHKAKGKFMQAMKEWKAYEYQLLHAKQNRMFHLADYAPEVRKKYGDITDQEYYDYCAASAPSHMTTAKTCLVHSNISIAKLLKRNRWKGLNT